MKEYDSLHPYCLPKKIVQRGIQFFWYHFVPKLSENHKKSSTGSVDRGSKAPTNICQNSLGCVYNNYEGIVLSKIIFSPNYSVYTTSMIIAFDISLPSTQNLLPHCIGVIPFTLHSTASEFNIYYIDYRSSRFKVMRHRHLKMALRIYSFLFSEHKGAAYLLSSGRKREGANCAILSPLFRCTDHPRG